MGKTSVWRALASLTSQILTSPCCPETQEGRVLCLLSPGLATSDLGQALGAREKVASLIGPAREGGWGSGARPLDQKRGEKASLLSPIPALQPAGGDRPKGRLHAATGSVRLCRLKPSPQPGHSLPSLSLPQERHQTPHRRRAPSLWGELAVACLVFREPHLGGHMGWVPAHQSPRQEPSEEGTVAAPPAFHRDCHGCPTQRSFGGAGRRPRGQPTQTDGATRESRPLFQLKRPEPGHCTFKAALLSGQSAGPRTRESRIDFSQGNVPRL